MQHSAATSQAHTHSWKGRAFTSETKHLLHCCGESACEGRVRRRSAEVALVSARIRGSQGGERESLLGASAERSHACMHS